MKLKTNTDIIFKINDSSTMTFGVSTDGTIYFDDIEKIRRKKIRKILYNIIKEEETK